MPKVQIDNTHIHYISNREDADPCEAEVVYVHGTGCNGGVFEAHMNALSCHALALDLSGHGQSGGQGYRGVVDHAHFVAEFITELKCGPCIVAGHSLGGGIVIALAVYYPELLRGLILIDTGARLRVAPAVIENAKRIAAGGAGGKTDSRQGFSDKTPQETVDALRRIVQHEKPDITLKDWYADDSCDFLTRVSKIQLPTLAVCGREDQLTPIKFHEYLRDNMPSCELQIIEDAGHWPFVEQPKVFLNLVGEYLHTSFGLAIDDY